LRGTAAYREGGPAVAGDGVAMVLKPSLSSDAPAAPTTR
jgi:hypothetical protein